MQCQFSSDRKRGGVSRLGYKNVRAQQDEGHEGDAENREPPARGQRRVPNVAAAEERLQRHEHALRHAARVAVGVVLHVVPPFDQPHGPRGVQQHGLSFN